MKTYPKPEYLILHKIRLIREKYPQMKELAQLEEEVLDIINVTTVEDLRMASIQAVMIRPKDLTDKTKQEMDQVLALARKCLHMEWEEELENVPNPEGT